MKLYTKDHEWLEEVGENQYKVGITKYAAAALGDIVYIEFTSDEVVTADEELCVIESVKAASGIISPVDGVILERNFEVTEDPSRVNDDPLNEWFLIIEVNDVLKFEDFMTEDEYENFID